MAVAAASALGMLRARPAAASGPTREEMRDALERIALLDEADGHELTVREAFAAVAIASRVLGAHPSQIFAERFERERLGRARGSGS